MACAQDIFHHDRDGLLPRGYQTAISWHEQGKGVALIKALTPASCQNLCSIENNPGLYLMDFPS